MFGFFGTLSVMAHLKMKKSFLFTKPFFYQTICFYLENIYWV